MILIALISTLHSYAALPPGFDLAKYQALIATASLKGQLLQGAGDDGMDYKVLTHLAPADATKPHKADYFSAVGGTDSDGHFGAAEVSMESEDWRIDAAGNWQIEQWMWMAGTDGTLLSVGHFLLSENRDGDVLDDKGLPHGDASNSTELARWGAKVAEWQAFNP